MELLPSEILNSIFLQLGFKQKTQCMLVCRSWADIIRSSSLLDTVYIHIKYEEHDILERLVDTLDSNPDQCAQVKHLVLRSEFLKTVHESVLFGYFTHLDSVFLTDIKIKFEEPFECKMEGVNRVRQHICKIVDFSYSFYAEKLLVSGLCSRLTHLTQWFSKDINTDIFFASLSNAPNLLHLTLSNIRLTIDILETIHNNSKQLETLVIKHVNFMIKYNVSFLADVAPASSIKTFSLHTSNNRNGSKRMLLEYAKRKYSRLENFGFWYSYSAGAFDDVSEFETEGIVSFVQHYGPQLKSLNIHSLTGEDEQENTFVKINESGCQLQKLTINFSMETPILKLMNISNQIKYIQELALHYIYDIGSYEQLSQFTSLTKLELTLCWGNSEEPLNIDISQLLDICSDRLETLDLGNVILSFDMNMAPEQQYHLKKLTLTDFFVPQGFDRFLSHHFQSLRYLKLVNPGSSLRSLNLENLHLTEFCFLDQCHFNFTHVSIETLNDKKYRDYFMPSIEFIEDFIPELIDTYRIPVRDTILPSKKFSTFAGDADSTSRDLDDTNKYFKVVCGSIQNVILNDRLAY